MCAFTSFFYLLRFQSLTGRVTWHWNWHTHTDKVKRARLTGRQESRKYGGHVCLDSTQFYKLGCRLSIHEKYWLQLKSQSETKVWHWSLKLDSKAKVWNWSLKPTSETKVQFNASSKARSKAAELRYFHWSLKYTRNWTENKSLYISYQNSVSNFAWTEESAK